MAKKAKQNQPKVSENSEEVENLKNQIARTLADYQNLEKRVAQEKEDLVKSANRGLILRLLPALDTLLLAQKHTKDEGINLSVKQIFDTLEREGLKKIETQGQDFDPQFMEAVHVADGEEGKVVEELRPGFLLNDKVLRAVQVAVGANPKH